MDVKEKIKFFAEKLDEITQRGYQESLRPLSLYELDVWCDKDKLDKGYTLECYRRVLYKKDLESPISERFIEASISKGIWNRVDLGPGCYRWEISPNSESEYVTVMTGNSLDDTQKIYVYPRQAFDTLGIYCDYKTEHSHKWNKNPIHEIRDYIKEQ